MISYRHHETGSMMGWMMGSGNGGYGHHGTGSMMGWMMGSGNGGYGHSGMGWMMGSAAMWMGIWLLLALAGLAVLVVVLVKLARGDGHRADGSPQVAGTPRLILDERYARGEIDEDEYSRRRAILQ